MPKLKSILQRKVIYLKKTASILKNEYGGDIPDNVEDLCKLPGVGPKMAHLCMNIAWKKQSGICKKTRETIRIYSKYLIFQALTHTSIVSAIASAGQWRKVNILDFSIYICKSCHWNLFSPVKLMLIYSWHTNKPINLGKVCHLKVSQSH